MSKPIPDIQPPKGCLILGWGGSFIVPEGHAMMHAIDPNDATDSWDYGRYAGAVGGILFAADKNSHIITINRLAR